MTNHISWHHLPLAPSPDLPVLLVNIDVGTASYAVQVTDMANIWTESLDRKAICIRAWGENTSIDPSDTADNMAKFLSSLRSALDSSQPGHDQTSITLSSAKFDDAAENGLTLRAVCNLPGLEPLQWPIHLKKGPPTAIATDLVLPLMQAHYARRREVESLVQILKHKDAALSKSLDKLEAVGTSLEQVFTVLSGRKKVTRSVAEEKVRGLAPFNERKWKASLVNDHEAPSNASDLLQRVFEGDGLPYLSYVEFDKTPSLDGWWHDVKTNSQIPIRSHSQKSTSAKASPKPPSQPEETGDDDDDDFQVQLTPPHLRSERGVGAKSAAPIPDDASTEDEDEGRNEDEVMELDSEPLATSRKASTKHQNAKKPSSRLGAIGGKQKAAAKYSPPPTTDISKERNTEATKDDTETASEADEDEDATVSIHEKSPSPPPQRLAPKKGGLGRIGGKKPEPAQERVKTPEPDTEISIKQSSQIVNTPKKLGRIGKAADPISTSEQNGGRGRQSTRQQESEARNEPRETSQERADRRRDELKRELEKKAAAGPAKKKRRF